ncbi:UDP-glucosyltransferase [Pseudonocardiaceae bacterium YIM PH 21723]|nr:UDP-glucosyltransferase [Pseudonocardiaceae bacterium YIM PH 21723]
MHIGFVCGPGIGHLTPVLAVARELVARGHRVTVPSTVEHRELIGAAGVAAPIYRSPLKESFRPEVRYSTQELLTAFRREAEQLLPRFEEIFAGDRPDLLVYDQATMVGWLLADRWGVPHVRTHPSVASNGHFTLWGRSFTAEILEFTEHQPDLGLVFCTRSFQPFGETFDERYRFVGPCIGERPATGWRPERTDRPLLYVSFGSLFNDRPEFYRLVVEAFRDQPWQVVMAVGKADVGVTAPNVELHEFAPQLEILRHASVFITHAGMGGVQEGLSAGVPLLGVPQIEEQELNADRIAELGLGRRLRPEDLTVHGLRDAVTGVLADVEMRDRLNDMRADIESAGGTRRAADILEAAVG